MADVIRVKARKSFQWEQDAKYIFVKVPMPGHTTLKNIQIFLSDLILRITSKQKKSVQTLDLLHEIDYLSHQNKFVLIDSTITATLKKKTQQPWQTLLIQQISLAQLKTRRKQSQTRYEQNLKQNSQEKQKLKTEYDRKATQEMMRFQEEERKKLDRKKEEEKRVALEEVFRGVDERTGRIGYQGDKWEEKGVKALEELEKQERQEYERQRQQRKKAQQQKYQKNDLPQPRPRPFNKNTQIFTQQDVKQQDEIRHNVQEQVQEIPVRKQAKVGVKFTEKLYPLVATRDYHYTEPPMPKGSAPLPPPKEGDLENRNPLWLKDRGDGFMRNKNYSAALDAYNEAIKIDPTQRKILMNRSLAHLKLLNFDSALNDCQLILAQMQKQLMNTEQNKDQSLLDLIKTKTRKCLCLAYKGNLKASKQLLTELLTYPMPAQQKTQLEHAQALLQARQLSLRTKLRGDQCVKRQLYQEAVRHYREAIEIDGNQYALSNLGLCFNKLGRYEEAIQVCERGLKAVEEFLGAGAGSSVGKGEDHVNLVVKLLYRKATAQQSLKLYKQSQQTLKKALTLSPQDPSLKSSLHSLTSLQSSLLFSTLKTQASLQLTQNSDPQSAITLYQKCLKLVESPDQVAEYLAVLQNLCVCYLRLQQWDNIVDSGRRILGIVNNLKSRVMDFQGSRKDGKQGKEGRAGLDRKNLDKIVVRTLMRRANAYVKLGQIYNAKSDLQKAVEIDPNDGNISKELEKLKESIGVK